MAVSIPDIANKNQTKAPEGSDQLLDAMKILKGVVKRSNYTIRDGVDSVLDSFFTVIEQHDQKKAAAIGRQVAR